MGTMRLLSRFRRRGDAPDPELLTIFERASERLEPGSLEVARARSRVTEQFEAIEATGGGLRKRLALAAAGGTGMWGTVLGTAAANKAAAAAVAIGVLAGGGVAAEASGLGPAVRAAALDAAGISTPAGEGGGGVGVQGVGPSEDSPAVATVEEAEDTSGNLVTVLRDDGSFVVRGVVTVEGTSLVAGVSLWVDAAGGSPTEFALADGVTIRLRGPSDAGPQTASVAGTLDDLVIGNLVLLQGQCAEGAESPHDPGCEVTSVTLLGSDGGQPTVPLGAPDGAGQPSALPNGAPADPVSQGADNKPEDLPAGPPLNPSNGPQN